MSPDLGFSVVKLPKKKNKLASLCCIVNDSDNKIICRHITIYSDIRELVA